MRAAMFSLGLDGHINAFLGTKDLLKLLPMRSGPDRRLFKNQRLIFNAQ